MSMYSPLRVTTGPGLVSEMSEYGLGSCPSARPSNPRKTPRLTLDEMRQAGLQYLCYARL